MKGLIHIQNIDDNECFKWILVRYLNFADLPKSLILVKIRDIHKIEEKEFH